MVENQCCRAKRNVSFPPRIASLLHSCDQWSSCACGRHLGSSPRTQSCSVGLSRLQCAMAVGSQASSCIYRAERTLPSAETLWGHAGSWHVLVSYPHILPSDSQWTTPFCLVWYSLKTALIPKGLDHSHTWHRACFENHFSKGGHARAIEEGLIMWEFPHDSVWSLGCGASSVLQTYGPRGRHG